MENGTFLKYGAEEECVLQVGTGRVNSVHHINKNQQIVSTSRSIVVLTNYMITQEIKIPTQCTVFIKEYNLIVGLISPRSTFFAYQFNMSKSSVPITWSKEDQKYLYSSGLNAVFHIIYSPKSSVIITFGSGINVWSFDIVFVGTSRNKEIGEVKMSKLYTFFEDTDFLILNKPTFDYEKELIYLQTKKGIELFDITGKRTSVAATLVLNQTCLFARNSDINKLLVVDTQEGITLWKSSGNFEKRFQINGSTVIDIEWIDKENIAIITVNNGVIILNILTGGMGVVCSLLNRPSRVFFFDDLLFVGYNNEIQVFRFVIPWTTWALNVPETKTMKRYERIDEAGQIMILTENAFMKFFAPRNGELLNTAVPSGIVVPKSCFYSRGCYHFLHEGKFELFITQHQEIKDEMYVALSMNRIYSYLPEQKPCIENKKIHLEASFICDVYYKEEWYYAITLSYAEVFYVTRDTFEPIERFSISHGSVSGLYFNFYGESLIVIYEYSICIMDVKSGNILENIRCKDSDVNGFDNDLLLIGYKDGKIAKIRVQNNKFIFVSLETDPPDHNGAVTGFSYTRHFWISSGMDGNLNIFDYDCMIIMRVSLPVPLYSCCIINAKNDIVVATQLELMKISGSLLFEDEEKDPTYARLNIDAYDEIKDYLSQEAIIGHVLIDERTEKIKASFSTTNFSVFHVDENNDPQSSSNNMSQKTTISTIEVIKDRQSTLNEMLQLTFGTKYVPPNPQVKKDIQRHRNEDTENVDTFITEPKVEKTFKAPRKPKLKKKKANKKENKVTVEEEEEETVKSYFDEFFNNKEKDPIQKKVRQKNVYDYSLPKMIDEDEEPEGKANKRTNKKKKNSKDSKIEEPKDAKRNELKTKQKRDQKDEASSKNKKTKEQRKAAPRTLNKRHALRPSKIDIPNNIKEENNNVESEKVIRKRSNSTLITTKDKLNEYKQAKRSKTPPVHIKMSSQHASKHPKKGAKKHKVSSPKGFKQSFPRSPHAPKSPRTQTKSYSEKTEKTKKPQRGDVQKKAELTNQPERKQNITVTRKIQDAQQQTNIKSHSFEASSYVAKRINTLIAANKAENIPETRLINKAGPHVYKDPKHAGFEHAFNTVTEQPKRSCAVIKNFHEKKEELVKSTPHVLVFKKGPIKPEEVSLNYLNVGFGVEPNKPVIKQSSRKIYSSTINLESIQSNRADFDELEKAVKRQTPYTRFVETQKKNTNSKVARRYSTVARPKKSVQQMKSVEFISVRSLSPYTPKY